MNFIYDISKDFFIGKSYKVCLIDVNSVFLFSGKNSVKYLYDFIKKLNFIFNNILIVNVIDNGINNKVLKKYPYYKANRNHSIQSNNIVFNKFNTIHSFKYKIYKIHKIDSTLKNNLTFYYHGESDFKIGYILKQLYNNYNINKSDILTVSLDKDFLICTVLSDLLLKRKVDKRYGYYLLDDNFNPDKLKEVFKIKNFNITNPYQYFYFLLLNGDVEDNIKQILTKSETINLLNNVINLNNNLNLDLILKYITNNKISINIDSIIENKYLVDLFNDDIFSTVEKNIMNFNLTKFFNDKL